MNIDPNFALGVSVGGLAMLVAVGLVLLGMARRGGGVRGEPLMESKRPVPPKSGSSVVRPKEYPGPWSVDAGPSDREGFRKALDERNRKIEEWNRRHGVKQ